MFSYLFQQMSSRRRERALTLGLIATVTLYLIVVLIAEPLRSLAQTSDETVVTFTVTGALSLDCDAAATGSAAGNGTSGSGAFATSQCTPSTNNALGYTLSWIIQTGSGVSPSINSGCNSTTTCFGTGHLISNNVTAGRPDIIRSMRVRTTGDTYWDTRPRILNNTTVPVGSGARWGGRLRAISTTPGGGAITWGPDTDEAETYLHVNTGSSINVAKRTSPTIGLGDSQFFLWKVVIPSGTFQPTGSYRARVLFTVTDN